MSTSQSQSVLSPAVSSTAVSPRLQKDLSSLSISNLSTQDDVDPDQLFTKHSVSEVKFIQHRLRAEADAKQEELRLMVGERYRDLLQASSSIISIAESSKRVKHALHETRTTVQAREEPRLPGKPSSKETEDIHLRTLQVLSAHMKLLLDAPEYLWRLIEKKRYLTATWLFLLSRSVYRSLEREEDKERWLSQGLDVLEQFPLIQRQWDSISHFRAQIGLKATQSFRDHTTSSEETCATALSLHLLESRPLADTLSLLLEQRGKTLATLAKHGSTALFPDWTPITRRSTNGHTSAGPLDQEPKSMREIRQAVLTALQVICRTISTARAVYHGQSEQSLLQQTLLFIQTETAVDIPPSQHSMPAELQLTTQTLLASMPSSTHFLLLPSELRSFRPYVDLDSPQTSIRHELFHQRLNDWFGTCKKVLEKEIITLFQDLRTVKEIWQIRSSIREWIRASSGLEPGEVAGLHEIFDNASATRIVSLWNSTILSAEKTFHSQLAAAITSASDSPTRDTEYLFQSPPLPIPPASSLVSIDPSFQKYKVALQKQLMGRTALLDEVLKSIESCARTIRHDLDEVIKGEGADTELLVKRVTSSYRPHADSLCSNVLDALETAANVGDKTTPASMRGLVFVGRMADELAFVSPFLDDTSCGEKISDGFRARSRALHKSVIERWRNHTISQLVEGYLPSNRPPIVPVDPPSPSPELIESLLSLSLALQEAGLPRSLSRRNELVGATLRAFILGLKDHPRWTIVSRPQMMYDLSFLRHLADLWRREDGWGDVLKILDLSINPTSEGKAGKTRPMENMADSLARMQLLLAILLPQPPRWNVPVGNEKAPGPLLPYGAPRLDIQYPLPLDLARPSIRFGSLLVDEK